MSAHADVKTTQQTYPARAGRSGETGATAERGTGSNPSQGRGEGQQKPGNAGCWSQDRGLAAGGGSREPRVHPRATAGDSGSVTSALGRGTGSSMRRLPGPAECRLSEGTQCSQGALRIVSGPAENTNSIFCDVSRGA